MSQQPTKTTITCYYRRNLKMSAPKLAAQVGHVVANLSINQKPERIVVLQASDAQFEALKQTPRCYVQVDMGLTEVEAGIETVVGWWE